MFFCHELCLINQIYTILELKIPSILLDFRGKPVEAMKNITKIYKDQINNKTTPAHNLWDKIAKYYPQGLTEGFFNSNPTDKNIKVNEPSHVAKAIGVVKNKLIAIEVYSNFTNKDTLKVKTPLGKQFILNNYTIKTLEGNLIDNTAEGEIVLLKWHKGVTPESLFYLYDNNSTNTI
jgi:hypothetical protein